MTTYPLSEPATAYNDEADNADGALVIATGTLAECADQLHGMPPEELQSVRIRMNNLDLQFEPAEVAELLDFLANESAGLSNRDIAAITDPNG